MADHEAAETVATEPATAARRGLFRHFAHWSLRTKFLVLVIPLFVLSTAAVFAVSELIAHREATEQVRAKLDALVAIHSAVLSESMWNVADEQIELILAALATDPDVLGAIVYDESDTAVMSVGKTDAMDSAKFHAVSDIVHTHRGEQTRIGRLALSLSDYRIQAEFRTRLIIASGLAALLLLSLVVIALIGNRQTIGLPLERLLKSINSSRLSGRRVPVVWHSRDEIGEVIAAFNEMQTRQAAYEEELREARDLLERRVEQRTRELAGKTKQLEQLSNQLAKFLPPQIYDSVFSSGNEVKIASSRKKLTVFFSDISGFTEAADRLESEALTEIVNHYLTEMSKIALKYGATIDKYMGDGIMIFFGDPTSKGVNEDALACVRMAIEMRERMTSLADNWRESGFERPLQVRMGIHTGFCTVGNFGSEDRMDYTIIGGAANTASRLESMATPGEILISYETYAHVRHEILCHEHGQIDVRGIAYPVTTYQVEDSFERLGQKRRRFRESHPNVLIELDVDAMDHADRDRAARILRNALATLSNKDEGEVAAAQEASRRSRL